MNAKILKKSAWAMAMALVSLGTANAAPQQFYAVSNQTATTPAEERDAFLAASTGVKSEGFESAAVGVPRFGTGISMWGGDGTLTQARFDTGNIVQGASQLGRFNTTPGPCNSTSTCKWWETPYSFDIALKSLRSAFGFFATDLGDQGGAITIDFWNDSNKVRSGIAVTLPTSYAGLLFFGWIDDAFSFNRVSVNVSQSKIDPADYDGIGFDDVLAGARAAVVPPPTPTPVSAPTPLALVALSLVVLAATRSRRKR